MTYKALLWDMDGTLIDSSPIYETALHTVNDKHQLEIISDINTVGMNMPELWNVVFAKSGIKPDYQIWVQEISQLVNASMPQLHMFDQALNVLQKASTMNMIQACVSNNTRRFIEQTIVFNQVSHLFDHWLGCEDFDNSKPHPEPYLQSVRKLNLQPQECLAIEDSAVGVASAQAAGLKVALFSPPHQRLLTDKADYVVKCHSELMNIIN